MRLIPSLIDAIFPPRETEVIVRNLSRTLSVLVPEPVYSGAVRFPVTSLFRYSDTPVQACIHEAKFEGSTTAAAVLGNALYEFLFEYLGESAAFMNTPPVLIPLPLSRARVRERGYNQTERITAAACKKLPNVSLDTELLVRVRDTVPQTSCTGMERQTNMKGAFAIQRQCDPLRTYIIVDDVITTGNTMLAAVEALKAGGAVRILPLTLAY